MTHQSQLKKLVGQMIISGFRGIHLNQKNQIIKDIQENNLGGVILYDKDVTVDPHKKRNIESPIQLKSLVQSLQSYAETPLFIAIDQEGGSVARLNSRTGFPDFQSWKDIGEINVEHVTRTYALSIAVILKTSGININLAPVFDVHKGKNSIIGNSDRCVGSTPEKVMYHSRIFIDAHNQKDILCVPKHFPGQGSAVQNSHNGITDISNTWGEEELLPYKILHSESRLDAILVGHVLLEKYDKKFPASLSKKIITELLRKKMGFDGLVICDDPFMRAISNQFSFEKTLEKMINAGIDVICLGNNLFSFEPDLVTRAINKIMKLITDGKITEERIVESFYRIQAVKKKYCNNE